MKRYLGTFGLLAFAGALLSLQASTIQSYAANSKAITISTDNIRNDTTPRSDTSRKNKKWKGGKQKSDSTWHKKDSMR